MNTWPNRGAPAAAPAGGSKTENPKTQAVNLIVRPTGSDSSQQASSKPGAVHLRDKHPPPRRAARSLAVR